jgi:AAA family ATP:ADP antiporter
MDQYTENRLNRLRALIGLGPGEFGSAAYSFLAFFFILCSYYIIRPIRDQMAANLGPELLPSVFLAILMVAFAAVPLFGWLVNKVKIGIVPTIIYAFFIGTGALFAASFYVSPNNKFIGYVFCVWVSIYAMYSTSIFWSLMSHAWKENQAKRLFPYISVGGTTGALTGPFLVRAMMPVIGIPGLMILSSSILFVALAVAFRIQKRLEFRDDVSLTKMGGVWSGVLAVTRSSMLRNIAIGVFMSNAIMALLYVEQARLVGDSISTPEQRVLFFSRIETIVSMGTIIVDMVVARFLLRRLGPGATASLVGLVALMALVILNAHSVLPVLVGAVASLRITTYGLWNPAMRVCYTTVSTEQKYKAQNLNDTLIYNGSPAVSSNLLSLLGTHVWGISSVLLLGIPMASAWIAIGVVLDRLMHTRRSVAAQLTTTGE